MIWDNLKKAITDGNLNAFKEAFLESRDFIMTDSVEFVRNRLSLLETAIAHKRKEIIGYIFEEKIVTPEQIMDESLDKTKADGSRSAGENISQIREQAKIFLRSMAGNLIINIAWSVATGIARGSMPDLMSVLIPQALVKAINSGMVEAINKKGMITTLSDTVNVLRNSSKGAKKVSSSEVGGLKPAPTPGHEDAKFKPVMVSETMAEKVAKNRDKNDSASALRRGE